MGTIVDDAQADISITVVQPYDFALSLRAMRSFQSVAAEPEPRLRMAARLGNKPAVVEIWLGAKSALKASSRPKVDNEQLRAAVEWSLFTELDLKPFYHLVSKNPKLAWLTQKLYGLKPSRPATLFEMAVTAITEQQISLAAAYQIRNRVVQRFGKPVEDLLVFPEPQALAEAPLEDLRSCGLSRQKSEYIRGLAGKIVAGDLDLDSLKYMATDSARETIMKIKGFGRWSADYILIRGLARPDCVPVDDLGVREVVGKYLGNSVRPTAEQAAAKLEPFRPFRGLLAFYFLAAHRLKVATGYPVLVSEN
ncbi:MAG TPA: DNA-3-methyladenine glycosylase [Dehalococcoidia bacterium]